jgi:Flp pilus assembly protein TadG
MSPKNLVVARTGSGTGGALRPARLAPAHRAAKDRDLGRDDRCDRPRGRGDDGAALVEFALVFPLLVFLVFAIFGAGVVLDQRLSVTQASREGARYGATVPIDQCTPAANCSGLTWAELVQDVTADRSGGAVTAEHICVALVQGSGSAPVVIGSGFSTATGGGACYVDSSADTGKRVQVKIVLPTQVEAAVMTIPIALDAEALTRFEG